MKSTPIVQQAILAIDLGSKTGWALSKRGFVTSGVLDLREKGKFSLEGYQRLYAMLVTQLLLVEEEGIGSDNLTVLVEIPHCGKFLAANRILFGLLGAFDMFRSNYGITSVEYRPKAIKKYWTGNGNSDKKKMVAKAAELGYQTSDHNEVDAIAMLRMHLSNLNAKKVG